MTGRAGGGFTGFARTYPLGTVVTLTAPAVHEGAFFAGWRDVRDRQALGLYESRTITIIVVEGLQAMKAIYAVPWSLLKRRGLP